MKKAVRICLLASVVALFVSYRFESVPIDQKLISIRAQEKFPDVSELNNEPIELQAALVDLGEDPLVLLKAEAALMVYPEMARSIFPLYASEPEFRRILRRHGEHILPPIQYFLQNSVSTLELINGWLKRFQQFRDYFNSLGEPPTKKSIKPDKSGPLTPTERGWYAVNFIDGEGADFLGQFQAGPGGDVQWVQTERITEGLTQFFTGGIRQLESGYRMNGEITASEIGWASVDVLVFASAVKILRAGRAAAKTVQGARVSTRSAALAARMTASARFLLTSARYAKWPAVIGVGYLVIAHPSVISDFFAGVAGVLGVPALAMQVFGWLIILIPGFYILSWLIWPTIALLRALLRALYQLSGHRPGSDSGYWSLR